MTWTAPDTSGTITGYKAQYRKQGVTSWTAYSGTLGASATTFNLAGLDAGATYEAQVRVVTSEDGDGAWSATGSGTANRPPAATSVSFSGGTVGVGGAFTWNEAPPLGNGAFFTDADSDALTYSAAAEKPALLGVRLSGDAGNAVLTANLLNQGSSKLTYTARDAYGGSVSRTTTIGITAKTSRSIAELTNKFLTGGSYPWELLAFYPDVSDLFSDSDSDTLTYSVSSEHPGIIQATLTRTTLKLHCPQPRTVKDYLRRQRRVRRVRLPYHGLHLRRARTSRRINENSPPGTVLVGMPVAGTPYKGGTLSYTLTGDAATAFTINSSTGHISVKEGATLDYETKSSYTGKVKWKVHAQGPEVRRRSDHQRHRRQKPASPPRRR